LAHARVWERRRRGRVNFFCIITSLAYGDVTVMPRFMVVVWGGDVVISFVESMGPYVIGV
jgi:hypothetical protein